MSFVAPLVSLIMAAWPFLVAGVAAALGTTAYLTGFGAKLTADFETLRSTLYYARVRAWITVRDDIKQLFASPLAHEALRTAGVDPILLEQQLVAAANNEALSGLLATPYPTLNTLVETDQYYALISELYGTGLLDYSSYMTLYSYYLGEYARLTAVVAPPTTIPTPITVLPTTWLTVPGFGTVGVRVRVGVAGAAPTVITAPTPTAPAPITFSPNINVENIIDTATLGTVLGGATLEMGRTIGDTNARALSGVGTTIGAANTRAIEGMGLSLSGALTGALPLVGTAFASGLVAQGQNLGHLMQLGRNQCFGGTAGALMNLLLPTALGAFSVMQLRSEEGIGGFITAQARRWFEGALDPARFPQPATPETVFNTATARLKEAMSFGLQAHMWAILGESNFVLKNLGLPQVAGFLAEMAGFQRLAMATLGTIETAALTIPMRYLAQRTYRPNIPGLGDLEEMYAKKEIPYEAKDGGLGLHQALALSGYSDAWAQVYKEHLWKDPRLGEIIRIGQFFNPALSPETRLPTPETAAWMERAGIGAYADKPGDWYYAWRAAKGGYDPRDVPVLVETARRAVTRREQTLFLDAITRLARDGFISLERARELTREGWGVVAGPFATGDPIEARARAIELQQDYKLLSDTRSTVVMSMSRGLISREEAREQLGELGLDGTRVELEVLKGTLGMVPGMRLTISRPEEVLEEAGAEAE